MQASPVAATTATITWTTNESASSTVEYGTTSAYGSTVTTSTMATSHSVDLSGLTSATTYHFRVKSADAAGNIATSTDNILVTLNSDVAGPTISGQTPADNATGTAVTASPVLTFNEVLDASTVNGATVQLRTYSGDTAVSATVSYNSASTTVTIDPVASLGYETNYYLYAVGVKDSAGNTLTTDYSSSTKASHEFTTAAEGAATLAVTSITPSSTWATAGGDFAAGWSWKFNITVPTSEASSSLKFADWTSGSNTIAAATNIRYYSAQSSNATSSASAITISAASTYGSAMTITSDLDSATAGNQIQVIVEARVPSGQAGGSYSTSYGVQSQ
ncbi:MAG: Ig-like domain-containing protein [Candidatus Liptonbacteria bacterium]